MDRQLGISVGWKSLSNCFFGDPQLTIVDTTGSPRLLTRLPEFAWSGIAVSRDGARVIYARADRRDANIGGLMVAR